MLPVWGKTDLAKDSLTYNEVEEYDHVEEGIKNSKVEETKPAHEIIHWKNGIIQLRI